MAKRRKLVLWAVHPTQCAGIYQIYLGGPVIWFMTHRNEGVPVNITEIADNEFVRKHGLKLIPAESRQTYEHDEGDEYKVFELVQKEMAKYAIKPNDIDLKKLRATEVDWLTFDQKFVVRSILLVLRRYGNEWFPFTVEQYKFMAMQSHRVSDEELETLHGLVDAGFLRFERDRYFIQDAFIEKLKEFFTLQNRS